MPFAGVPGRQVNWSLFADRLKEIWLLGYIADEIDYRADWETNKILSYKRLHN